VQSAAAYTVLTASVDFVVFVNVKILHHPPLRIRPCCSPALSSPTISALPIISQVAVIVAGRRRGGTPEYFCPVAPLLHE